MKKLGWIGLGNMGTPMAKNLEKAGFSVSVFNRTAEKTKPFEATSATISSSVSELVADSDIIFTMLSNDAAIQATYDEIFLAESIQGKIFIDMSTISQQLSESIAEKVKEKGGSFLDAPVAGSTQPAINGALIIMVGGEAAALETARPYLEKLGKLIKHLGANGKGIAAKLSVNYFISILYLGLAETVLFAEKTGIERSDLLEIINESAAGSGATKVKTPLLISEDYSPAFSLSLMFKDLLLAQKNGADYALTSSILDTYSNAEKAGLGNQDVISIINYLKEKA